MLRWPTPIELLTLRCPVCWGGPMFRHPLAMHERCACCDHVFDPGHGYFLGAMYFSYALVVLFEVALVTALKLAGLSWTMSLVIGAALIPLVGPAVAFPYSRHAWVMIERRFLRAGVEQDAELRAELARRKAARDSKPPA